MKKNIIKLPGSRLEPAQDFVFRNFLDWLIALQAKGKRPYRILQMESLDDLDHLFFGIFRPDKITVGHRFHLEKFAIAGQDRSPFPAHDSKDLAVGKIIFVTTVQSEQSQITGQFSQMHVENEFRPSQGPGPQTRDRADIKRFKNRVHADVILIP